MRKRIVSVILSVTLLSGIAGPAEAHNRQRRRSAHHSAVHRHRPSHVSHSTRAAGLSATQAESVRIIRAVWPDHLEEKAIRVARCESNLIPTAKNRRSSATGLFQMLTSVHGARAKRMGNWPLTDGEKNARAALDLQQRSGWRPWVCKG